MRTRSSIVGLSSFPRAGPVERLLRPPRDESIFIRIESERADEKRRVEAAEKGDRNPHRVARANVSLRSQLTEAECGRDCVVCVSQFGNNLEYCLQRERTSSIK